MLQCLEADPDQTAIELLATFMVKHPGIYRLSHLRTLQRRVSIWRREEMQRLISGMHGLTQNVGQHAS